MFKWNGKCTMWNIREQNKNWNKPNEQRKSQLTNQEIVVVEDELEIKKLQLEKLMNQRKKWRGHNRITLSWFFLCEW